MHAQIYTAFTTKLERPDEPVAPHLAMGETFQLGPNNIPYTHLGRYRCANTPAKTLVGDRACYWSGVFLFSSQKYLLQPRKSDS